MHYGIRLSLKLIMEFERKCNPHFWKGENKYKWIDLSKSTFSQNQAEQEFKLQVQWLCCTFPLTDLRNSPSFAKECVLEGHNCNIKEF